jgi:rhodanese-related sulfurtransferase
VDIFPQELAALLKAPNQPHLLDVREPEEHAVAAIPNSRLIPLGQLAGRASELSAWKDEDVIVYCHHGIRSLHAIHLLKPLGFTRLSNLSGGIDAWSREVDPNVLRY